MIVRWGPLDLVAEELGELGIGAPLLVAGPRWDALELPFEPAARWKEVPSVRVEEASELARDGVVAIGGGSTIDLGKAISATVRVPLISVPTTYSGAEWTQYFGVRDPDRRMRGGGSGARLAGIVYDVGLTVGLPREETVGTSMNALAHCAEALYAHGHNPESDEVALEGARLISEFLPRVVESPLDRDLRTELLRGASNGGEALAGSMLALAHAMAQAVGGKYGLPHGTLNGICLPPVLLYNARYAPAAVRALRRSGRRRPGCARGRAHRARRDHTPTRARCSPRGSARARRVGGAARRQPGEPASGDPEGDRGAVALGLVSQR